MGGQLTYEYIGTPTQPNLYRITCLMVRHCSGIPLTPPSVSCRVGTPATACTTSDPRNTTVTLSSASVSFSEFNCPSTGNACNSTSTLTAFSTERYTGTVELPPAPSWTLSVVEGGRTATANVNGISNLYLETTLNSQLTLADGTTQTVRNSSPLVPEQTPLVYPTTYFQRGSLTFTAYDADGDSLVYSLAPVLDGCNQPLSYTSSPGAVILDPSTTPQSPCVIVLQSSSLSPTFPVLSVTPAGSCPVKTSTSFFAFNPRQGSFTFAPSTYDASVSPTNAWRNLYVVVGKITEYRRIGGRYYAIGSVRREMMVQVVGPGNWVPASPVASGNTASNTAGTDSLVVEAGPQGAATASFRFSDPDAGQQLTLRLALPTDALYSSLYTNPAAPDVPVSISGNGTATPTLQVRLRPSIMGRTYRIPVQVEDNACPVKAIHHYVLVLRATSRPTATAAQPARTAALASAYPTPFTDQVTLTLPRPAGPVAALPVTDALGRVVARLPLPTGTSPTLSLTWTPPASLPAGLYLLQLPGQTLRLLRQ